MKNYLVELTLHLGEYEKTARSTQEAETPEDAAKKALEGECHNDPKVTGEGLAIETWDDCWVYRIYSVNELTNAEAAVFEKFHI